MLDLTHLAVPAFIILMLLEAVVGAHVLGRRIYEDHRDTYASLAMGVGSVFINLLWKLVVFAYFSLLYGITPLRLGASVWVWIAALLCDDFCYYWFHRLSHEVRILWAAHVNHHSSRKYNLSTALRQSWTTPFTGFLFWSPMPLLGFDPMMIFTVQAISLLYQFWIHTETISSLGPVEYVFNTPSHHRVHHATNIPYLDRNHGGTLIIWDRIFGTFAQETERPVYGLTKNIESYNPIEIAVHEWRALWKDVRRPNPFGVRLAYCLKPPGWSPDGSTETADQLREKWGGLSA
jgi:sterol desaturase/sphingolipid hydroxylase (fatty acid hydroxylase superfamily)